MVLRYKTNKGLDLRIEEMLTRHTAVRTLGIFGPC